MKRFFTIVLVALLSLSVKAQTLDVISTVKTSCVSCRYEFVLHGNVEMKGAGSLLAQGNCIQLISDDMEIWSDGVTRWTVDPKAREIVIEKGGIELDDLGLEDVVLNFDKEKRIFTAEVMTADGSKMSVKATEVTVYENKPLDVYAYQIPAGSDWVVTDLR